MAKKFMPRHGGHVALALALSFIVPAAAQGRNHLNNARPANIKADPSGSVVLFAANGPGPGDAPAGVELWASDGFPSFGQTLLIQDIEPGPTSSFPADITFVSPTLAFFTARTLADGRELWRIDGGVGARMAGDIHGAPGMGSDPADLTVLGNRLFFTANNGSGRRLWYVDVAPPSVPMQVATAAGYDGPDELTVLPGTQKLLFVAKTPSNGVELCIVDGPTLATSVVLDINPGGDSTPHELTSWGPFVYFVASAVSAPSVPEVWKTDGASMTSVFVSGSTCTHANQLTAGNQWLAFTARSTQTRQRELFQVRPDGTLRAPHSALARGHTIDNLTAGNTVQGGETFWFTADDPMLGVELWRTDAVGGTIIIRNIAPAANSSHPTNLMALPNAGALMFRANDGASGHEPWVSNGSFAGTIRHTDIKAGAASCYSGPMTRLPGERVVFSAEDRNGIELWHATWNPTLPALLVRDIERTNPSQPQLHIVPSLTSLTFEINDAPPSQFLGVFLTTTVPTNPIAIPGALRGVLMGVPEIWLPPVLTGNGNFSFPLMVPRLPPPPLPPLMWQGLVSTGRDGEPYEATNNNSCGSGTSDPTQGGAQVQHSSCADDDTGEYRSVITRTDAGTGTAYLALIRVKPGEERRLLEPHETDKGTPICPIEASETIELHGFMDFFTPVDPSDPLTKSDKLEIRLFDEPPAPDSGSLGGGKLVWRSYC